MPDAHAQLIEMQLHLEEVGSNVDVLQEKVLTQRLTVNMPSYT